MPAEETASRNAVKLAKKPGKTPPNMNNVNDFFFHMKKTNNKYGKQTNKVNNNKLKEENKRKKSCYTVSRYAVTGFTNNRF